MRPIDRGPVPQLNGIPKVVADYKDWRTDLIERIGKYCSYCNMVLNDSPQVEHVVPKNPQPDAPVGDRLEWNNLLLACGPCNRAKSNHPNDNRTHYNPDYHNTHLAFQYVVTEHPTKAGQQTCIVVPTTAAENKVESFNVDKAQASINLCGLDKTVVNKRATDLRWKYRLETVQSVRIWRQEWDDWGRHQKTDFLRLLVTTVQAMGFFSIWFSAFEDDQAARQAIIEAFPGTCARSFSQLSHFQPQVRALNDL